MPEVTPATTASRLAHLTTAMSVLSWSRRRGPSSSRFSWASGALKSLFAQATMVPSPSPLPHTSRRGGDTDLEPSVPREGTPARLPPDRGSQVRLELPAGGEGLRTLVTERTRACDNRHSDLVNTPLAEGASRWTGGPRVESTLPPPAICKPSVLLETLALLPPRHSVRRPLALELSCGHRAAVERPGGGRLFRLGGRISVTLGLGISQSTSIAPLARKHVSSIRPGRALIPQRWCRSYADSTRATRR